MDKNLLWRLLVYLLILNQVLISCSINCFQLTNKMLSIQWMAWPSFIYALCQYCYRTNTSIIVIMHVLSRPEMDLYGSCVGIVRFKESIFFFLDLIIFTFDVSCMWCVGDINHLKPLPIMKHQGFVWKFGGEGNIRRWRVRNI